jgi:hypothetical protein
MKELMVILRKYIEFLHDMPVGQRDYYDQQKVEDLEVLFDDALTDIIDKRVEEALEHHECGTYHNDSEY